MSQQLYSYLQGLQAYMQAYERRIQKLEKQIASLQAEVENLQSRPPIHIDTIEYKFDQLKVESLEGTLNIGMNPTDLQEAVDEFAVENQGIYGPNPKGAYGAAAPKDLMYQGIELENQMYRFMEDELPQVVQEVQSELNIPNNNAYLDFIRQDISKQLPSRIDYYLRQAGVSSQERKTDEELHLYVADQLKKEIKNGVATFMRNLPDNVKGMKEE